MGLPWKENKSASTSLSADSFCARFSFVKEAVAVAEEPLVVEGAVGGGGGAIMGMAFDSLL
jgi:hypothetical protein